MRSRPLLDRVPPPLLLLAAAFVCYGGPTLLRIGFYHDDWTMMCAFEAAGPGLWGRTAKLYSYIPAITLRPMTVSIFATEHLLFGARPLYWALTALAGAWAAAWALYGVARRYGAAKTAALLAALAYLAYPSKDSTLLWPSGVICSASLAGFLAAWLAHLEYARTGRRAWRAASALLLAWSLLVYELVIFMAPVFFLAPAGRPSPEADRRRRAGALDALLVTAAAIAYKQFAVPMIIGNTAKPNHLSLLHFAYAYAASVNTALGPRVIFYTLGSAWRTLAERPLLAAAAAALAALALRAPAEERLPRRAPETLLRLGALVFALGVLPLALSEYTPTPINHQNRVAQAFLVGVALLAAGLLSRPRSGRARAAAAAVAAVCLAAHADFAEAWAESSRRQLQVRDIVLQQARDWPAGALLLVRMPERYVREKAPVFDASWDVSGATRLWLRDPERFADTLRPTNPPACGPAELTIDGRTLAYGKTRLLDVAAGRILPIDRAACERLRAAAPTL